MEEKVNLISYIAPGAPATRRPYRGILPYLRPEIGFTPRWYHEALGIGFGEKWHTDPAYRRETRLRMYSELERRFPGSEIGRMEGTDVLTGTFGAVAVAAIYGIPVRYGHDQWPATEHQFLSEKEIGKLVPPDLENNDFFNSFLEQLDWIRQNEGQILGFMNWQGVLNNAQRLRGPDLFMDFFLAPEQTRHLLDCVCNTMMEAALILQKKQSESHPGFFPFFTVSNCLVNMVDAEIYEEFLLPLDQKIAAAFGTIGIHNCAWNASPYLHSYTKVPGVAYLDMGMDSGLEEARRLFRRARRAIMYTPMDLANKSIEQIRADLETIALHYGPCDIVAADIEAGTPDSRIIEFTDLCHEIYDRYQNISDLTVN